MERLKFRLGWALASALGIILVLALARATIAGPLDPPGPVGSTMRTIDELLPSWGRALSSTGGCSSERFSCVMSNAAVLDHETGLVWLRNTAQVSSSYAAASQTCQTTLIGGRLGWRLPTLVELYSLVDKSVDDSLPDGNPFQNVVNFSTYWTSTINAEDDQAVQTVTLFGGNATELPSPRFGSDNLFRGWCVRGGDALVGDPAFDEGPAWSRALSAAGGCGSARFKCVLGNAAVLDRETGLVWQKVSDPFQATSWQNAQLITCSVSNTGGRMGWRLPLLAELDSLLPLPAGHPFALTGQKFWTTSQIPSGNVIAVDLTGSGHTFVSPADNAVLGTYAWCVRGAPNDDGSP